MTANKHIAMWAVPRSRSTAITRAFEQLDECIIYDEPLYGAYFVNINSDYQFLEKRVREIWNDDLLKYPETDYQKVIQQLTGNLPEDKSFSFQKHISRYLLPKFGRNWLKSMKNFFLIRDPRESIISTWKPLKSTGHEWRLTCYGIGWEQHYALFKEIEALTGQKPLVIDSTDLVKDPRKYLEALCFELGIDFSEKMLSWSQNPKDTKLIWGQTDYSKWYEKVLNSQGFFYEAKEIEIPALLMPFVKSAIPFYEELFEYRMIVN